MAEEVVTMPNATFSMEEVCADVVKATKDALAAHGIKPASVIVNFAWREGGQGYVVGTAVPRRHRALLRDSLRQSFMEAQ